MGSPPRSPLFCSFPTCRATLTKRCWDTSDQPEGGEVLNNKTEGLPGVHPTLPPTGNSDPQGSPLLKLKLKSY